ncbi:hypothetical protein AGOR_G00090640 [Albula goreensis]|uniref:Uncharacterized protein n=1 Tax=Albula goreensis TaxID=1534307 RepID=A0A8T3DJM2_9TELE|nr:hypothetical protein AGOR_G00090640 [Albula goreensis]
MRNTGLLLGYFLVEVLALVCNAEGEIGQQPDGFVMVSGSNGSREGENVFSESPHLEDRCRGYYDVMGQWDPPGYYGTGWDIHEARAREGTSTSEGKHVQGSCECDAPAGSMSREHLEREDSLGLHVQHYENMQGRAKANNLQGTQMNNVGPGSPLLPTMTQPHSYPALGQLGHAYDQQQPSKELNKYASLKAVAEKANDDFYNKRRHLAELAAKGSLPLHPIRHDHEPATPYSPEMPCPKQNGHKSKSSKGHSAHPLAYSSSTMANAGMAKGWNGTETVGRRKSYGPKKHCTVEQVNELHTARSQHFLPPQPYFVTNSKTEVTV